METLIRIASVIVIATAATLVVVKAAHAPAPAPLAVATDRQRTNFASSIASHEEEWRNKSLESFPSDHWSQRDDFHNHEAQSVRDLAKAQGASYEDVFRAVDDDIHRNRNNGRERSAGAVPLKPRPIFD